MCLATLQAVPFIAEENLTVYKILRFSASQKNYAQSILRVFRYQIGTEYHTSIRRSETEGYFSEIDNLYYSNMANVIYYSEGFHSFLRESDAKGFALNYFFYNPIHLYLNWANYVFKCTIPKGSEYYTNDLQYVVSNKIIIEGLSSDFLETQRMLC